MQRERRIEHIRTCAAYEQQIILLQEKQKGFEAQSRVRKERAASAEAALRGKLSRREELRTMIDRLRRLPPLLSPPDPTNRESRPGWHDCLTCHKDLGPAPGMGADYIEELLGTRRRIAELEAELARLEAEIATLEATRDRETESCEKGPRLRCHLCTPGK